MRPAEYIKKNLNVPNVLTLIRLLLVPVYIIVFAGGHKYTALIIFLCASITDFLDGYLARKHKLITDFGKLMDPLADKLMVITAMLSMTIGNEKIPPVLPRAAVIIVMAKEALLLLGGTMLLKKGIVVHSLFIGKAAQCTFIFGLIASYFHDWFTSHCIGWFLTPDLILIWLAVLLCLTALVWYAIWAVQLIRVNCNK